MIKSGSLPSAPINNDVGIASKIYSFLIGLVQNPANSVLIILVIIALVLFLMSKREKFQDVDFMYLKNEDDYLCCDLSFKKDKPSVDNVKMLQNANGTVSIKFDNDHYVGVNENNLLVSNPLDSDCNYEFVLQDNILRAVKNGMYVARSGNDLVLSSTKDRALHLNAE